MVHVGDITQLHGGLIPPVDCITFGSPCQDLSIAGKRAGLEGERSGLFMEAVRVIREMLEAYQGEFPSFAVWENVTGAFSSNKGEDFRAVLEELAHIKGPQVSVPRPEGGKWAKAGFIAGNGWSIAWRTFDAQFWGVPQRRRRIAVVLDLRGGRAGEVLFERTGLSGHPEPSFPPWQGVARDPARSTSGHDREVGEPGDNQMTVACVLNDQGGQSLNVEDGSVSPTLRAESHNHEPVICMATGQGKAEKAENLSPTLSCNHEPPIVFESHSQDARYTQQGTTSPSCTAQWGTDGNNMPLVVAASSKEAYNTGGNANCSLRIMTDGTAPTMRADTHPSGVTYKILRWIVRRLTPTECERLQGFPDGWTDIGDWVNAKGKRHKAADGPRYKALGNSIALPQWWWLTCKMAQFLPEHATLGSLFDGIGGFPLVWEARHGKGTAVWASEIEEFPIAVTQKHFPE